MKQNPLSDAKFSIWSDFYVRFEAIFLCYLKRIFRFEAIWNEIRYLRAIWNEMFVPSEAKSVIWMKFWIWSDFVCDMKWNLLSEENFFYLKRSYNVNFSCDFLSEIRYLTRHFQFETIFRAICSNFFVRSESKSHANFPWDMKRHFISGIWSKYFVRYEAIFTFDLKRICCTIWSEICYLKRNVRFQAIFSCDIKEYFDLKRLFREIWSHIFEIRHLMRIFRAIWSENGLKRTFRLEANFSCDMKWVLLCDLKRNMLSESKLCILNDFYVRFQAKFFVRSEAKSAIWSILFVRYEKYFQFEAIFLWNMNIPYLTLYFRFEEIFTCDLKRFFVRSEAKSAIWNEMYDFKPFFRAILRNISIWSDCSVRYEATFSKSGIWCEYFVRYEAKTVWSELFDWKRIFRAIWSEFYCVIWSEILYL